MAGQPFQTPAPKVVGVELDRGSIDWVTPKDVILELLRRRGVRAASARIFEFYGPGVANLDVTRTDHDLQHDRRARCDTGLFPSDQSTRERRRRSRAPTQHRQLSAERGRRLRRAQHIELDQLEPRSVKADSWQRRPGERGRRHPEGSAGLPR